MATLVIQARDQVACAVWLVAVQMERTGYISGVFSSRRPQLLPDCNCG